MDAPSVLAVVVVRDGAAWIRRTLASLARQTHSRFGVLAIDNASSDGSAEILEELLGARRVIRLEKDHGFPGAVRRVLELDAAREADYLLLLHDDTALDPDAVERLVEEAQRVQGVGIVGPKVLDWDDPQVLLEIGFAADRLGYPHTPLEPGEIDQGQYDAPREVLFVSSAAMLVARDAWMRAGPPDDRLRPCNADLEFCWRIRLGGFRVLVAPKARAYHRMAGARSQRPRAHPVHERYHADRSALAALLTNERIITLLWVLPIFAVFGLSRLVASLFARRFDLVGQALGAWGWNLLHLPGTVRRRARAQAARRVRDHEITRFMTPAGSRVESWLRQGSALLTGRRVAAVEEGEEPEAEPLARRVASLLVAHPVAVAFAIGVPLLLLAFRGVLLVPHVEGGALPVAPGEPADFFREFLAPWRSTAFGSAASASPALVVLGLAGFATLGSTELLFRLLVALTPVLAGASCYRALRRLPLSPVASVAGAAAYAFSALTLWTASEGRIPEAAMLIALPWLWGRFRAALGGDAPGVRLRWIAGTGIGLGLAFSFYPPVIVAAALLFLPLLAVPESGGHPLRGAAMVLASVVAAAALAFPFVWTVARAGGSGIVEPGRADFGSLLRLSPGPSPGDGLPALFVPVAALIGFALIEGRLARAASRALFVVLAAMPLAWLAAAGYLPAALSVPAAYLGAAALSMAMLVGGGVASTVRATRRVAFGSRQLGVVTLGAVLALGLAAQGISMIPGGWRVGETRIPPAWAVVATDPDAPFRVLWLRQPDGEPFPPPAADPDGVVSAGGERLAYAVTGAHGRSALRLRLPAEGKAFASLERAIAGVLSGEVRHGGAALAPFAIRYVVAEPGSLGAVASSRLADQVDLDLVQREGGLLLYRSPVTLPLASALPGEAAVSAGRRTDLLAPAALPAAPVPLRLGETGWSGSFEGEPGLVLVSEEYDAAWEGSASGASLDPFPAFGWAVGFPSAPGELQLAPSSPAWTVQLLLLALLWALALWLVRRRPAETPRSVRTYRAAAPEEARRPTPV